jgi:hypothetical protein
LGGFNRRRRPGQWLTLSVDLPAWQKSLAPLVDQARAALEAEAG